ncbi:MAG: ACP S-malonyltransferase [Phycisphaerae bacterium]|nr:ACP S-malonyltransferase [Phycisphaerae bacterium]
MKTAMLCPGQGAQHVGMGKDFYQAHAAAREVFDQADAALGYRLSSLCFEGPEDKLQATDQAQVGIFVTSVAIYRTLEIVGKPPAAIDVLAGLSLGEYTALHIAGALSFADGLKLVQARGQLMQASALARPSTMLALVGADDAAAEAIARASSDVGVIVCANFNAPGQVVLSGSIEACQRASQVAQEKGFRAVQLSVAGAFHSPFMAEAANQMKSILERTTIVAPKIPVISNVTALPHTDAVSIRRLLVEQIVSPVRWAQSMSRLLADGVNDFAELGPGRVLTGLMKKIDRQTRVKNISTVEGLSL